ncbi:cobalamin B12-binding domain-containing protein [Streptomyces sp. NPDC054946]
MSPVTVCTPERLVGEPWDAVLALDEPAALTMVLRALDDGMEAESVLLDVIAAVQGRVGEEWAANRVTVAQEHAATAIDERAVAALARHPRAPTTPSRRRITVAYVDGDCHALPARLPAEVLRLRGRHVDHLGAQVPTPHLMAHLHRTGSDVVALSSSIPTRLPAALYTDDAELFSRFLLWTADVLSARRVPARCLLPALDLLHQELKDFPRAAGMLRAGAARLTCTPLTASGTAS